MEEKKASDALKDYASASDKRPSNNNGDDDGLGEKYCLSCHKVSAHAD